MLLTKSSLDEKFDYARRQSKITPNDLETIRETKQAQGEAFASGGRARYYEPIDAYEGWYPISEP